MRDTFAPNHLQNITTRSYFFSGGIVMFVCCRTGVMIRKQRRLNGKVYFAG